MNSEKINETSAKYKRVVKNVGQTAVLEFNFQYNGTKNGKIILWYKHKIRPDGVLFMTQVSKYPDGDVTIIQNYLPDSERFSARCDDDATSTSIKCTLEVKIFIIINFFFFN